ncbi:MAG: cell division protein SepF [Methanobrevibacter sp.]|nr:cell division protein SepF [Methanobrevibacter sp.]
MSLIDKLKESLGFPGKEKKSIKSKDFERDILDDDGVIEPEQPYYEIILIRPESMDDMDYVSDQIIEEKNPVIVDLSYFEEEGFDTFQMAGNKINILRQKHGAESILLSNTSDKNMIIISPPRINIVKKE